MDCQEKPCTCDHIDYTLWAMQHWGEDCSYQFWSPQCSLSGVYSPVQHKRNPSQESPVRWCSDPQGGRIFGQEKVTMEVSLMTCGCSRKRWELEQEKGVDSFSTDRGLFVSFLLENLGPGLAAVFRPHIERLVNSQVKVARKFSQYSVEGLWRSVS